jgi:hypothetical protein
MPKLNTSNVLSNVRVTDGLKPYKIDEVDANTTYMMYFDDLSGTQVQKIIKILLTGTVTSFESATDLWANRASATYSPING